jgi:hypothetical protein
MRNRCGDVSFLRAPPTGSGVPSPAGVALPSASLLWHRLQTFFRQAFGRIAWQDFGAGAGGAMVAHGS